MKVSIFCKLRGLILKTVTLVKFLKTRNNPEFSNRMYENFRGSRFEEHRCPSKAKLPYILFLPVPHVQFSVINLPEFSVLTNLL